MKEHIYGWYPSTKDVYKDRGFPSAYHMECLYKYRASKYYTPPRPLTAAIKYSTIGRSKSVDRQRPSTSPVKTGEYCRTKPVVSLLDIRPAPMLKAPTPMQAWAMSVPETSYTSIQSGNRTPLSPAPPAETLDDSRGHASVQSGRSSTRSIRIKSAHVHRERSSPPRRSIKSAGPCRSISSLGSEPRQDVPPSEKTTLRPRNPTPFRRDECEEEDRPSSPDYEEMVEKYGWRAQVHGDPLGAKRLPKRLPYTVKVAEPELEPDPPKYQISSTDTFFYNTIPRKPATFTIHTEWVSEVLHAKRMELQKREGLNYRYKNFSFVY